MVATLVHVACCLLHCMRCDSGARSPAMHAALGVLALVAFRMLRVVRCVSHVELDGEGLRAPSPSVRRVALVRRAATV